MTERETLKLALKALEEAWYHVGTFQPTEKAIDLYDEARTAIKEALANEALEKMAENARELGLDYEPPQRKPQIWEHEGYDALCQELELWKAEAQRKPLTDEEIQNILPDDGTPMSLGEAFVKFARAIEAAHGIKGEA